MNSSLRSSFPFDDAAHERHAVHLPRRVPAAGGRAGGREAACARGLSYLDVVVVVVVVKTAAVTVARSKRIRDEKHRRT